MFLTGGLRRVVTPYELFRIKYLPLASIQPTLDAGIKILDGSIFIRCFIYSYLVMFC